MPKPYAIAIDIGGANVKAGLLNRNRQIGFSDL